MENNFSMLSLFTGDLMTVFVSIVLVAFSVMSWAIIIEKIRLWNMVKRTPVSVKNSDNLDVVADKLIKPFDKNLWFLSLVAYISPFIGLLTITNDLFKKLVLGSLFAIFKLSTIILSTSS